MATMQYQEIGPLSRTDAETIAVDGDPPALAVAVIAVALHEDDLAFAQQYCVALAQHADAGVRGNAVLAFGHLARRFRTLKVSLVVPLVEAALRDENAYVRGQAHSAVEDLNHFLDLEIEV